MDEMFTENTENLNQLINLTMKFVHIFLNEKHPQIPIRSIDIFQNLLKKIEILTKKQKLNYDFNITDNILIKIKDKLGDVNIKLRAKAVDLYCFMLKQNFCDYNNLLSELLEEEFKHIDSRKIIKTSKIINGKLSIFDNVFDEFQNALNEKRTEINTFPLNLILSYTVENLSHSKSEIRKISRNVLVKISAIFGYKKIENSLKKTDERELEKLIEQIPEVLELVKSMQVKRIPTLNVINKNSRLGSATRANSLERKKSLDRKYKRINTTVIEKTEDAEKIEKDKKENKISLNNSNNNNNSQQDNINLIDSKEKENTFANNELPVKTKKNTNTLNINKNKLLICSYCGKSDKKFTEQDKLDEHIIKECLLFHNCLKCKKNIEIRLFNNHILIECQYKSEFKVCKRCKEGIDLKEYEIHIKENSCNPAKNINSCNRCPLCHKDVPPLDKGFVQHLVNDTCPSHTRK